jgi:SAM-dependent methyltransferase
MSASIIIDGVGEYGKSFVDGLIQQSKPTLFMLHRIFNIIKSLRPKKCEKILEIGCGVGTVSNEISKFGCDVTGIDFSPPMIKAAQNLFPEAAKFSIGNAKDLSEYRGFDAIVAADVMEHLTDDDFEKVVIECRSALTESGRLVIYSPCKSHFIEVMKRKNLILRENHTHIGMRDEGEYLSIISKYFSQIEIDYEPMHIPIYEHFEKLLGVFIPAFRRRIIIVAKG